MNDEYATYKTPSTIVSETVYHFLRGGVYGAAYGLVCPCAKACINAYIYMTCVCMYACVGIVNIG